MTNITKAKRAKINAYAAELGCDAINRRLKALAAEYAASCDAGRPNLGLFHKHGRLMRLRNKVLTGQSYAAQDAAAQRSAERSERAWFDITNGKD